MGDRSRRITWILGPASLGYTDEIDVWNKVESVCWPWVWPPAATWDPGHAGSQHVCTCAYKRIMLTAFNGMRLREANCWSLWSIYLSLLWGTSIWSRDDVSAYFPRGLVLKKSCVRHMAYLLLLIDFQVKSWLIFVYSWPQVRNIN